MLCRETSGYNPRGVDDAPSQGLSPVRAGRCRAVVWAVHTEAEGARATTWEIDPIMPVYVDFDVPADLEDDAVEALQVARDTGSVKKGTNETTKAIERGNAELVFVAEDVSPEEVVMHIPELASEKDIPYLFVETQDDIGHAAGLEVGSAAAAIVDPGEAASDVEDIAGKLEELN
jgi:large subunit ribosomal protein L7Ae